ncbi:hypothetical protein Dimus_013575 [Dionaea muscipula]
MAKGRGHVDQSFHVPLQKPAGEVGTSSSEAQLVKKLIRSWKWKKATTEVATVEEETPTEVPFIDTQESEAVASKAKSQRKTRSLKKDIVSPAVGENEVKVEAEGHSEETQSDRDAVEDDPTMEATDVPFVDEKQSRKRRLRKAESTRPATKKAMTGKGEVRPVGSGAEQRNKPVVTGSPMTKELD